MIAQYLVREQSSLSSLFKAERSFAEYDAYALDLAKCSQDLEGSFIARRIKMSKMLFMRCQATG